MMAITYEGTWEEILEHESELKGQRVKVIVLSEESKSLSPKNQRMLEIYNEWLNTPLTDEERQVLDDFEQFRKEHPFKLRRLEDEE